MDKTRSKMVNEVFDNQRNLQGELMEEVHREISELRAMVGSLGADNIRLNQELEQARTLQQQQNQQLYEQLQQQAQQQIQQQPNHIQQVQQGNNNYDYGIMRPEDILNQIRKIPTFSGIKGQSLMSFIYTVEDYLLLCGSNQSLTKLCMGTIRNSLLQGEAANQVKILGNEPTWTRIKEELIARFKPERTYYEVINDCRWAKTKNLRQLFDVCRSSLFEMQEIYEFDSNKPALYQPESCENQLINILKDKIAGNFRNIATGKTILEIYDAYSSLKLLNEEGAIDPNHYDWGTYKKQPNFIKHNPREELHENNGSPLIPQINNTQNRMNTRYNNNIHQTQVQQEDCNTYGYQQRRESNHHGYQQNENAQERQKYQSRYNNNNTNKGNFNKIHQHHENVQERQAYQRLNPNFNHISTQQSQRSRTSNLSGRRSPTLMDTDEIIGHIDTICPRRKPIVKLTIGDTTVRCLIDTGSTLNILTTNRLFGYKVEDLEAPIKFRTLTGEDFITKKVRTPVPTEFNHPGKTEWKMIDLGSRPFEAILGLPSIRKLGMKIHPRLIKVRGNTIRFIEAMKDPNEPESIETLEICEENKIEQSKKYVTRQEKEENKIAQSFWINKRKEPTHMRCQNNPKMEARRTAYTSQPVQPKYQMEAVTNCRPTEELSKMYHQGSTEENKFSNNKLSIVKIVVCTLLMILVTERFQDKQHICYTTGSLNNQEPYKPLVYTTKFLEIYLPNEEFEHQTDNNQLTYIHQMQSKFKKQDINPKLQRRLTNSIHESNTKQTKKMNFNKSTLNATSEVKLNKIPKNKDDETFHLHQIWPPDHQPQNISDIFMKNTGTYTKSKLLLHNNKHPWTPKS